MRVRHSVKSGRDDRGAAAKTGKPSTAEVVVQAGPVGLGGTLALPEPAIGIVVFAHGSGSSRFSPRNQLVSGFLNEGGLATLLFDLLTPEEHEVDQWTRALRFDIGLLTRRLVGAVDWLAEHPQARSLRVGLFGASTGVAAVVSRGGRPDLAMAALPRVRAATLLIVGGLDEPVIAMNREAAAHLKVEHRIEIVPGATHLFEEPGKLEEVARLARDWFQRHLR